MLMEDLIPFLLFVAIGGITLISKIVEFKKKAASTTPVKPPAREPAIKSLLTDFINEITSTPKVTPQQPPPLLKKKSKPSQPKKDQRKSLIPEESSALPPPHLPATAEIKDSIIDSEIGSDKPLGLDALKNNRRFAIICHEVLGKPKALRS